VITEKMQRVTSQFPTVRSVTSSSAVEGVSQADLVLTAEQSWAETNLAGLNDESQQVAFNEGEDLPGPVSLAAVGENFNSNARLVVYGDAEFVTDAYITAYGNSDLMVNSIDWAVGQENLINLTPKNATQRLMIPPQRMTMNLILLTTVIILPGLILLAGIFIWAQRRRRG
jgi:ABC-type uncharacterized transport system involved in gliding motility auxiliary subunit